MAYRQTIGRSRIQLTHMKVQPLQLLQALFCNCPNLAQTLFGPGCISNTAFTILDTLLQASFLAVETANWEGILKQGMYHQRKGLGVNESVMWGDYFFLEALLDALNGLNGRNPTVSARPGC